MATNTAVLPRARDGATFSLTPALSLWKREVVRFYRNKSRVVGVIASPLLFWIVIGSGFGTSFQSQNAKGGQNYLDFFFPGALIMIVLFTAIFTMMSVSTYKQSNFDFLINNAGTALYAPVTDVTEKQMNDIFDIHFKGVFFLTQKALPLINDGGSIINISSGLTRITYPGSSVYASMKTAVETLTRYLAKELGGRKIRVNVVAPGAIETDFGGGRTRDNKEINAHIASLTALGRVGLPDDIGGVVAFLCTEDAGWINGQRIEVSGGQAI